MEYCPITLLIAIIYYNRGVYYQFKNFNFFQRNDLAPRAVCSATGQHDTGFRFSSNFTWKLYYYS